MSEEPDITGFVTLRYRAIGFPAGGLTARSLRIELIDPKRPDEAWISEIINLGGIPWFQGETRAVSVRIMAEKFRRHVLNETPSLQVRRGSDLIGTMELEKQK